MAIDVKDSRRKEEHGHMGIAFIFAAGCALAGMAAVIGLLLLILVR